VRVNISEIFAKRIALHIRATFANGSRVAKEIINAQGDKFVNGYFQREISKNGKGNSRPVGDVGTIFVNREGRLQTTRDASTMRNVSQRILT
jgi:hypothetical protein